jgi:hypothetical protein
MRVIIILIFSLLFIRPALAQPNTEPENKKAGITFSFPWVNYYHFVDYQKKSEAKKSGFFGIGIGFYYKKNETKISFNVSTTDDLASPIAQINYSKLTPQSDIGTSFAELLYQRSIYEKVHFIGGLNFTSYIFRFSSGTDSIKSYIKTDDAFGLTLGLEYRFNKNYSFAAVYRPALENFETDTHYRHLVTLEFRIDIDVWKKKFPI